MSDVLDPDSPQGRVYRALTRLGRSDVDALVGATATAAVTSARNVLRMRIS